MKKVRDWSDDLLWRKVGARNFEAFASLFCWSMLSLPRPDLVPEVLALLELFNFSIISTTTVYLAVADL